MINNFLIFGDSYSTHRDCIPNTYPSHYYTEGRSPEEPNTKMRPEETWWGRIIDNTDAKLVLNDSWSGSTIGYTGYSGDCSKTSSFIRRFEKMRENGFFRDNKIDTVFIFGGTNDSWSNAPLGNEQYSDWKREDLFCVLPAISYFISLLKLELPSAKVVVIANTEIKPEIIECMRKSAELYGVDFVELADIEKVLGHPTVLGMEQIYQQVMKSLSRDL